MFCSFASDTGAFNYLFYFHFMFYFSQDSCNYHVTFKKYLDG